MPSALIGALRVQLGIDSAQFTNGLGRAQRQAKTASSGIERSLSGIGRAVAGLTAGFSAMAAAQAFLTIADKAKGMDAQLRLATASFGSFNEAQEDSRRIAQEARGGLVETATLYTAFLRTSQEIGRSQRDAAQATETFSKALKIGGADTSAVASATLQMKQALSSATVQWEELGPILEASPRIAKVLTDAFGVTRTELKKMAEDGKLSGKMMFDALNKPEIIQQINKEFGTLGTTFAEAVQQVENAAIITFGAFDRGGQFSKALADFVTQGGDGFASLEKAAEEFGINMRSVLDGLSNAFDPILASGTAVFDALGIKISQFSADGAKEIRQIFAAIDEVTAKADKVRAYLADPLGQRKSTAGTYNGGILGQQATRTNLAADFDKGFKASQARLRADQAARNAANARNNGSGGAVAQSAGDDEKAKKAADKAKREAEKKAREAERKREKALRDKYQLDREEIDGQRELLAAKRDLLKDATDRAGISVQLIDLERQARDKQIALDLAMGDINAKEAERRRALADQLAVLDKQRVWQEEELRRLAGIDQLEDAGFDLRQRALQGEANLAETAAERREVEMRILDLAYEEERAKIERLKRGSYEDQQEAAMRERALPGNYARDRAGVMQQTRGPWESFLASLPNTAAKANEAFEQVAAGGLSDMVDGLADAMTGARSLGDVFKQVAQSIIRDLLRIQLQKALAGLLTKGIGGALGGITGGAAGAGNSLMGEGGMFGDPTRMGAPIFKGFPKLAGGGVLSVLGNRGLDTNLLSINGMPAARVNRGERIRVDPNSRPANDRQMMVMVEKSPLFEVTVREEARTQATAVSIDSQRTQTKRARNTMGRGGR